MNTFKLPDLGEGLEEAEIVSWHVSEGDNVVADQPLVSVETDKAVVEVPSPQTGRIDKIHGGVGSIIKVGAPLVEFEVVKGSDKGAIVGELAQVDDDNGDRRRKADRPSPTTQQRASPAVRALARKLDVDLTMVGSSGKNNTVTREDVERAAKSLRDAGPASPLRGMRRAMAQRMARSHREVVPASVTEEALIDAWQHKTDITIRLIRAVAAAAKAEPALNAWYSSQNDERRLVERIDVGIPVDTPDGLIVPVLRNIGARDIVDLRKGLDRLRSDVKARIVPPEELRGATITLSNFGMIGGLFANLVIVPPQVAIVGAGRIDQRVIFDNGKPVSRRMLPLSLTFDHRVITGGEAARFLTALKADLEASGCAPQKR